MSMTAASHDRISSVRYRPNEFDRKRIERALAGRMRYRYVSPSVLTIDGGYIVRSPCCSRNVDPNGGVVDVAMLLYDSPPKAWHLYGKDHDVQEWYLHATYDRLAGLLEHLNADPSRRFWQ